MKSNPSEDRVTPIKSHTFPSTDLTDQIRLRAYELYEKRGKTEGHAQEDWLEAESEITEGKGKSAGA